MNYLL